MASAPGGSAGPLAGVPRGLEGYIRRSRIFESGLWCVGRVCLCSSGVVAVGVSLRELCCGGEVFDRGAVCGGGGSQTARGGCGGGGWSRCVRLLLPCGTA